jgi:hypothetical protein
MQAMQFTHHIQAKSKATRKYNIGEYIGNKYHFWVHKTNTPQPTMLTPQKMDERRENGLCFNCDNKYHKGNTYNDNKLFYMNYEEEEYQELEPS